MDNIRQGHLAMSKQTATEWLRMMAEHSPLTDCHAHFTAIANEIECYRDMLASIKQLAANAPKEIPAPHCLDMIRERAERALINTAEH